VERDVVAAVAALLSALRVDRVVIGAVAANRGRRFAYFESRTSSYTN
jgi:hypothetical protein